MYSLCGDLLGAYQEHVGAQSKAYVDASLRPVWGRFQAHQGSVGVPVWGPSGAYLGPVGGMSGQAGVSLGPVRRPQ